MFASTCTHREAGVRGGVSRMMTGGSRRKRGAAGTRLEEPLRSLVDHVVASEKRHVDCGLLALAEANETGGLEALSAMQA